MILKKEKNELNRKDSKVENKLENSHKSKKKNKKIKYSTGKS